MQQERHVFTTHDMPNDYDHGTGGRHEGHSSGGFYEWGFIVGSGFFLKLIGLVLVVLVIGDMFGCSFP